MESFGWAPALLADRPSIRTSTQRAFRAGRCTSKTVLAKNSFTIASRWMDGDHGHFRVRRSRARASKSGSRARRARVRASESGGPRRLARVPASEGAAAKKLTRARMNASRARMEGGPAADERRPWRDRHGSILSIRQLRVHERRPPALQAGHRATAQVSSARHGDIRRATRSRACRGRRRPRGPGRPLACALPIRRSSEAEVAWCRVRRGIHPNEKSRKEVPLEAWPRRVCWPTRTCLRRCRSARLRSTMRSATASSWALRCSRNR